MNTFKIIISLIALSGSVLVGCGDDGDTDGGTDTSTDTNPGDTSTDTSPGDTSTDTGVPDDCTRYCDQLDTNCGTVPQYADRAECESYCAGAGWPLGTAGEMSNNTIECRIYHAGDPASMDPDTHCPHAGPSGATVCGSVGYRVEPAAMFTRVDRLGMPAVSTALIGTDVKNAYNDDDPAGDAMGTYVPELGASVQGLHDALDDDLAGLSLVPCSMAVGTTLPECFEQEILPGSGVSVASLVVPDTLQIDGTADAGFPNGRMLADPVMDVTLAIILLDMTTSGQDPFSFVGPPSVNPAANDVAFNDNFPYLAAAQTP